MAKTTPRSRRLCALLRVKSGHQHCLAARDMWNALTARCQITEDLMSLKGVGRKTANVVGQCLSDSRWRWIPTCSACPPLGLAHAKTRKNRTAADEGHPRDLWNKAHHWLIFHGRRVCKAQRPCATAARCCHCVKTPYSPPKNRPRSKGPFNTWNSFTTQDGQTAARPLAR